MEKKKREREAEIGQGFILVGLLDSEYPSTHSRMSGWHFCCLLEQHIVQSLVGSNSAFRLESENKRNETTMHE